uniref:Uncharacterized protein n=1 Tax=Physcomitrium patens TaxID=3218 RepID=A0A2K1JQ10_PHYPA|nr:hypothetical protein PHYPA_016004 [Physcomitrium patens]
MGKTQAVKGDGILPNTHLTLISDCANEKTNGNKAWPNT